MPTTITISEFQPSPGECNFLGTTVKLRRYYDQDWQDVDGTWHSEGVVGSSTGFFDEISGTLLANTITIPAFPATPTDNAQIGRPTETWQLWDQAGSPRNVIFEGFIPSANPVITFGALQLINKGQTLFESDAPTRLAQWIQSYIDTVVGVLRFATSVIAGWVRLSWPAANPSDPIAVSDNDPRVPTQNENDALVGTSGTPSSSNKYVTNSDVRIAGATFNVRSYSFLGSDTVAFNAAIDALNLAGKGVLYAPGDFTITSTLHTITADGQFYGDGMFGAATTFPTTGATQINFTSPSTNAFNVASKNFYVHDLSLSNTAGSTPSAGYGFNVTGSDIYQKVDLKNVTVHRFYKNIHQAGGFWRMENCVISSSISNQFETENTFNDDAGDWTVDSCYFITGGAYPPIAMQLKNGGRINNVKILGSVQGIECPLVNTSNLQISNTSIELITGNGIKITGDPVLSKWSHVQLSNVEILFDPSNTTNFAIYAIGVKNLNLSNVDIVASVTPVTAAIALASNCANWSVGSINLDGWSRDFQTDGTYTGTPLPAAAVSALTISSNKIMPEYNTFHLVSGGATLKNIFLNLTTMAPFDTENHTLQVISNDGVTWDTSGNIGNAGVAAAGALLIIHWNRGTGTGGKWYIN